MGFSKGRKGKYFPSQIKDLDYDTLHNSQLWVLADAVGARRALGAARDEGGKRAVLKQYCEQQPERAQRFYEIIVLGKDPSGGGAEALPKEQQEHYVSLLSDVINQHKESLDSKAKEALEHGLNAAIEKMEAHAKKAISDAADRVAPIVVKEGTKKRVIKGVMPTEFKRMVQLASARIPIMLVGPAGCGKTYLSAKLAEALDLDYSDNSCSEGMSESVFNGRLLPIGKGGAFEHVASPFMERYEKGGVHLLDEMDAGDPNLFTYINKAIANDSYTVDQRYENPVVKKSKDFVLVAAANTFGHGADAMYVGRNQLDAATLDRFKIGLVTMDYSKEVESSLAPTELCEWAWHIREQIRQRKLRRIMSTRVIKDLATMTELYEWKKEDWESAYFSGWSDEDRRMVAHE